MDLLRIIWNWYFITDLLWRFLHFNTTIDIIKNWHYPQFANIAITGFCRPNKSRSRSICYLSGWIMNKWPLKGLVKSIINNWYQRILNLFINSLMALRLWLKSNVHLKRFVLVYLLRLFSGEKLSMCLYVK